MMPKGLREYLSYNGRHFSKPMYEWAVRMMEGRSGEKIRPVEKSVFDEKMKVANHRIDDLEEAKRQ